MTISSRYRVCIVGLGPAGLGAALTLSKLGMTSELVCLDQGVSSNNRTCSILLNGVCEGEEPCQMISGFGGSSLLSGGKVSAFPAGSGLVTILGNQHITEKKLSEAIAVLSALIPLEKYDIEKARIDEARRFFEKRGFTYKYFDVYQFDYKKLKKAYEKILSQLQSVGVSVLLNAKLMDFDQGDHGFSLKVQQYRKQLIIHSEYLILGLGRSGQSILELMNAQLDLGGKGGQLDVGVRLEFPTNLFPPVAWYHRDLKLLFKSARTFCVCKDGCIAPYVIDGMFYVDGNLSPRNRSGFTNLGIITRFAPSGRNKMLLKDIRERAIEQRSGKLVCQMLSEYLGQNSPVTKANLSAGNSDAFWVRDDINNCFPTSVSTDIREAVRYFAERLLPKQHWGTVKVFAPEIDYAGILFPVKSDFSVRPRLHIIGDCIGQFRGIAQALCSGIVCAESLIGKNHD